MTIITWKVRVTTAMSECFGERLPIHTFKSIHSLTDTNVRDNFYRRGAKSAVIISEKINQS
jgi:hypothetical protein